MVGGAGRSIPVADVVKFSGSGRHQKGETAVQAGKPVKQPVIERLFRNAEKKDARRQQAEQEHDPVSNPVIDLDEHAPAVGRHLATLCEVFCF